MTTVIRHNPGNGEPEEVDAESMTKPQLVETVQDFTETINDWRGAGERIADAAEKYEAGDLSGDDLVDEIWAALEEADPDTYEDDEEAEAA